MINLNLKGVIRIDDEGVQVSALVGEEFVKGARRLLGMFLLVFASDGVLMTEDEVQFVVIATFVRTKHDGVRGLVKELLQVQVGCVGEQLHIATTAILAILEFHFISVKEREV